MSTEQRDEQLLANAIPEGIIIFNQQQQVQWWNHNAEDFFELALNQPANTLFNQAIVTQLQTSEVELKTCSTPKKTMLLSLKPFKNKQQLLIIKDITQLHQLEQIRQDFIANVSHELRTPLTVIHGYLEMLMSQPEAHNHDIFNQMFQHSQRMETLIEGLLLLSRLETSEQHTGPSESVDIHDLLQSTCESARILSGHHQHHIHLTCPEGTILSGYKEALQSIFSNLIFNAIHYTPAKGDIWVALEESPNQLIFSVKDTGIGIEQKHLSRLTERFYRVDKARSRKSGGTGLGLAIVKHALILHHAELNMTSTLGKGSTFTCYFPK